MKISLNWLRDYIDLPEDVSPQQLAEKLTMSTVEVEQVIDVSKPLDHIVVGRISALEPHPTNESLSIVDVEHGRITRVVCGASNLAIGMKVALATNGAVVRDSGGQERVIGPAMVGGVESAAMICSAGECGLSDAFPAGEREILDLTRLNAEPGTPLAVAIGYDDVVLEIDNKSLTNRPDLWGHHGIAREVAAQHDRPLRQPPAFGTLPTAGQFEVRIDAPDLCRRYTATRVTGVSASISPPWLQARLAKVGQRSINLLVDLTNYVMLAVGQPTHVFDARDLSGRIEVRRARAGERLVLLDGTDLDLDSEMLVIANHEVPLGLAGIMGGERAIREDTTEIWLEAANFLPIPIRRTARRFGLRTESSTRFEKGIDLDRVELAQQLFLALLAEAQPSCRVVQHVDVIAAQPSAITVAVPVTFLQRKLGVELPAEEMRRLLERLQFGCKVTNDVLHVDVPTWRATGDVSLPEDIVEEVARLYGYERLAFTPPVVRLEKAVIQPRRRTERRVREYLAFRAGMREVVSYPWVAAQALDAAGMSDVKTIGLAHPPSADMRLAPSLVPQLLSAVAANLRHQPRFRIFEMARVFLPPEALAADQEQLPNQPHHVAAAFVGSDARMLFLEAKAVIERLDRIVQVERLSFSDTVQVSWGDPAAQLAITSDGKPIGVLALASARTRRKAGIRRAEVAMFEIDVDALLPLPSRDNSPESLPTYPQVEYDISMIVASTVKWSEAFEIASRAGELVRTVTFVDEYAGSQLPAGHKSLTIRLHLGSDQGTLVREQIDETAGRVVSELTARLNAVIRKE
jgi:phenylalanyl-tRNA synthetase, beta subunit, non-spirochete bacterial